MRKIAFGYSTLCNIKCSHCVAATDVVGSDKMELAKAKEIIVELALADVSGISFTAGEPFIYFDDLLELIALCHEHKIYTRVVTNSYWAKSLDKARDRLKMLKEAGLSQLRLSYSRWHQQHVPRANVLNAAQSCKLTGIDYFISFVTDFSKKDNSYEQFLCDEALKYFPEPVIYAGRAVSFYRDKIFTDYQENLCAMNAYLAPDLTMYGCCDAGSHFNTTNFFLLGNLNNHSINHLFTKSEVDPLYSCIRGLGISTIASFAGFKASEVVTYRKCDLCKKLFNSPEIVASLREAAEAGKLNGWVR